MSLLWGGTKIPEVTWTCPFCGKWIPVDRKHVINVDCWKVEKEGK
jgi:hypothetical protein